jgi:hypothetical protein
MAEPAPLQPEQNSSDPQVGRWIPPASKPPEPVREIGGRKDGSDPTRYGDWEKNGRCIDF